MGGDGGGGRGWAKVKVEELRCAYGWADEDGCIEEKQSAAGGKDERVGPWTRAKKRYNLNFRIPTHFFKK